MRGFWWKVKCENKDQSWLLQALFYSVNIQAAHFRVDSYFTITLNEITEKTIEFFYISFQ